MKTESSKVIAGALAARDALLDQCVKVWEERRAIQNEEPPATASWQAYNEWSNRLQEKSGEYSELLQALLMFAGAEGHLHDRFAQKDKGI